MLGATSAYFMVYATGVDEVDAEVLENIGRLGLDPDRSGRSGSQPETRTEGRQSAGSARLRGE